LFELITDADETADKVFVNARQLIGNNYLNINELTTIVIEINNPVLIQLFVASKEEFDTKLATYELVRNYMAH
ncbi:unnamed protein product, partial [Adineta steineri]